ncbi:ribonuclease H, partial [Trifolium medium]|nr:ribonuclease H [Trifolium medium]
HCYTAVITNIQDMLKLNWDVTLSHSLWKGNFNVDFLAKLGSANNIKIKIWEFPPEALKSILFSYALRVLHPKA